MVQSGIYRLPFSKGACIVTLAGPQIGAFTGGIFFIIFWVICKQFKNQIMMVGVPKLTMVSI